MLGRVNRLIYFALLTTFVFPVLLGFILSLRGLQVADERIFFAAFASAVGTLIWCAINVKSEPNLTRVALWILVVFVLFGSLVSAASVVT